LCNQQVNLWHWLNAHGLAIAAVKLRADEVIR
jgi:hypothetical protein